MKPSPELFSDQFLQMRERCLSLAADLDRLARAPGGTDAIGSDPRLTQLRSAMEILLDGQSEKARRVLEACSDHTPYAK